MPLDGGQQLVSGLPVPSPTRASLPHRARCGPARLSRPCCVDLRLDFVFFTFCLFLTSVSFAPTDFLPLPSF